MQVVVGSGFRFASDGLLATCGVRGGRGQEGRRAEKKLRTLGAARQGLELAEGQMGEKVKHFLPGDPPSANYDNWRDGSNFARESEIFGFQPAVWRNGSKSFTPAGRQG
jgi:hypothetical protein